MFTVHSIGEDSAATHDIDGHIDEALDHMYFEMEQAKYMNHPTTAIVLSRRNSTVPLLRYERTAEGVWTAIMRIGGGITDPAQKAQ